MRNVLGVCLGLFITLLLVACDPEVCLHVECGPNSGGCVEQDGEAVCVCLDGWIGDRCTECDEGWLSVGARCLPSCSVADLDCGAFGACVDNDGEPMCLCQLGYAGDLCDSCDEGFEWQDGVCECICEIQNGQGECIEGVCNIASCDSLFANCDGDVSTGCETPLNSLTNCGGCGVTCEVAHGTATCGTGTCEIESCDSLHANCDGDVSTGCETPIARLTNCGGCGITCEIDHGTATCATGTCEIESCDSLYANCDGDVSTGCETPIDSLTNCGGCGVTCEVAHGTPTCATGTCGIASCDSLYANCDGDVSTGCETPIDSLTSCGGCGIICDIAHGTATCSTGTCEIESCNYLYDNCDGRASTGCDTHLITTVDCGGCGVQCIIPHGFGTCETGTCQIAACEEGRYNCDNDPVTGCESSLPCHCETDDWPDPEDFRDRNCDGVVGGNASVGVFVCAELGNDENQGSAIYPVKTIARGLEIAATQRSGARREVYVAKGTYEGGAMAHVASIFGAYENLGDGQWDRDPSNVTRINSTLHLVGADRDVVLELLWVEIAHAPTGSPSPGSHGQTVVGLALGDSEGTYYVRHVDIEVGRASYGAPGLIPDAATPGANGPSATSKNAVEAAHAIMCPSGSLSYRGGDGGRGGYAGHDTYRGSPGGDGDGRLAGETYGALGAGGDYGYSSACDIMAEGGKAGSHGKSALAGGDGYDGHDGAAIQPGQIPGAISQLVSGGARTLLFQKPSAGSGEDGTPGRGGGGGGGGGAYMYAFAWEHGTPYCDYFEAGGGGAGGMGGCPGGGGGAGGSGGSSIGILVLDANLEVSHSRISTDAGGDGGPGQVGVVGAPGGSGGHGYHPPSPRLHGGDGGAGGHGGEGGSGAGGAGGSSIGILHARSHVLVDHNSVAFERGSAGIGGQGGYDGGSGPDGVRAENHESSAGD